MQGLRYDNMVKPNVGIVDYGVGNLMSVGSASEKSGASMFCSGDPELISDTDAIILPGVGAFAAGSKDALKRIGMFDALQSAAKKGTPILGICLGMQLLFEKGEEFGVSEGLGLMTVSCRCLIKLLRSSHKNTPHWLEQIAKNR